MHTILVPVDGSANADRAVAHVVALAGSSTLTKVHLLNVEPTPVTWQTHGLAEEATGAHLSARGEEAMTNARAMLGRAGIPFEAHVELGEAAETIVRATKTLGCDSIVMGTRGLGLLTGAVLGSVAYKVVHLAEVPVTLVK